ncbi:sigma-70 family RNA polymerase sigma factor [Micromonospora sp. CPCC 206061]|uniref:sigma-70 family RNA polymerase sigma factor n=1 Tax=Micromonospora sp. CPCC 206061 TaxID=3122410 RepID=UPI002FEF1BC4
MTHSEALNVTALVRAAQAGSKDALNELVAAHLPVVYNVISRALNGHADVDDLVQETMVRVIRGLPGLREPDRFRSWAVTIAYRQLHLYLRNRRKAMVRVAEAPPDVPDPGGDFAEQTVNALVLSGQRQELAEAVRWLEDADRQLLALWWQEATGELTRAELAAAIEVKPKHAAMRVRRLRERLDAARGVVRALRARPRCAELGDLLQSWNGVADPLWRKRLIRHTRDCPQCTAHRHGLATLEDLALGATALPVPLAVVEGLRIALEAAAPAAQAAPSLAQALLAQVQGFLHNKLAATAAATAVASGGFAYAVYHEPAPPPQGATVAVSPTAATRTLVPQPPALAASPTAARTSAPPAAVSGVAVADVYVAANGSDANDGSLERPYATLAKAVAVVRPGQTIALRGGTYRPTEPVAIDTSGDPERRITLSNYRGERPVIDASRVPAESWAVTHRGGYWTVQGLEIKNSRSHAYVCLSCRGNIFRRLSIHDNVRSGLTLRDPGTVDNQVLDSDFWRNYDPTDAGHSGVGLAIKFGSGTGNVVRGCRAFDNADSGFDLGEFADAVRLEYNWAYGNGVNRWNATVWQSNADGFHLGGVAPAPHLLRHNASWANIGHGFSDAGNSGRLELSNNTAFRNGGIGFHMPGAAATMRSNASVDNAGAADLGRATTSSRNTWDGGAFPAEMFESTDPSQAQGQRRPDGRLPATDYLTTGRGVGASMREPGTS